MKYNKKLSTNDLQLIVGGMRHTGPSLLELDQMHMLNLDKECRCVDNKNSPMFKSWSGTNLSFCYDSCCKIYSGTNGTYGDTSFRCHNKNRDLLEGDTMPSSSCKKSVFGCC